MFDNQTIIITGATGYYSFSHLSFAEVYHVTTSLGGQINYATTIVNDL